MQKSFEMRSVTPDDYSELKRLWVTCFDDTTEVVENFFDKTVTPEGVIATFDGEKAVNAMYLLESEINIGNDKYNALYVYAVCTDPIYRGQGIMRKAFAFLEKTALLRKSDYLFLVPANESLFEMYKKLGFKTGFTYTEEIISVNDFACESEENSALTYENYLKARRALSRKVPIATLKEKGFNSFYMPVGDTVKCVCNNSGYAVFEIENGEVTVHELFGEKNSLVKSVMSRTGKNAVTLRKPTENGCGVPFGMYRSFGNVPEITDAFFGIPYGG